MYRRSIESPEAFWGEVAATLHWFTPWERVREWNPPWARWFIGGKTNLAYNCLDRHLETWRRNKAALIWEGEPGEVRTLTYAQLHREVCRCANALRRLGVTTGDRVGIYMPLVPEAVIAMLACARIGATHSVIFGGFSADAVADRLNDAEAKLVITADGGYRKGGVVALKSAVDGALVRVPSVSHVLVVRRTGQGDPDGRRARPLVARDPGGGFGRMPGRTTRRRASALHPVHQRHDRQAQGRRAHDRRLSGRDGVHRAHRVRSARRGRLLVHRRYRLGHRPQLRGLWAARERRHRLPVRGRAQLAANRIAGGR